MANSHEQLIDESNIYYRIMDKKRILDCTFLLSMRRAKAKAKAKECGDTRTLTSSFDVTPREGSESTNMGLEPTAFR
jgi:hypothetical protein